MVTRYQNLEPRLSLRYRISVNNSVKLSYNRLNQFIHLISNTTAATPVDVWQLTTAYIPPQQADNFSLGYFHNFNDNEWETSIEGFYRIINSLVETKDLPQILLNDHLESEALIGEGKAYGLELSMKRNTGENDRAIILYLLTLFTKNDCSFIGCKCKQRRLVSIEF